MIFPGGVHRGRYLIILQFGTENALCHANSLRTSPGGPGGAGNSPGGVSGKVVIFSDFSNIFLFFFSIFHCFFYFLPPPGVARKPPKINDFHGFLDPPGGPKNSHFGRLGGPKPPFWTSGGPGTPYFASPGGSFGWSEGYFRGYFPSGII